MSPRPGSKAAWGQGQQRDRPDGALRQSQLVGGFGPGALVDLVDHAVLIMGLDSWRFGPHEAAMRWVDEPRLRDDLELRLRKSGRPLRRDRAFVLPPAADEREATSLVGIRAYEFPRWFVCQNPRCETLARADGMQPGPHKKYLHDCRTGDGKPSPCVPVRFVVACERGHLDDVPWIAFVHGGGRCPAAPALRLREGATGDFQELMVECACGARRRLYEAYQSTNLPPCSGQRPWLGPEGRVAECKRQLRILVRSASNTYFAQVESALTLPEPEIDIQARVLAVWDLIATTQPEDLPAVRRGVKPVREKLEGLTDAQVLAAMNALQGKPAAREPIRDAEFRQFANAEPERRGEIPGRRERFFARTAKLAEPLPRGVSKIVLASKLREIRVQIGFTRIDPRSPDIRGEHDLDVETSVLGLQTDWLPASEIIGEGIFIQFDEAVMHDWETSAPVVARAKDLLAGYQRTGDPRPFPGARFYFLHSLSHLLMSALSQECGYPASALRERIYCAPAADALPMAAILISTGTSGTEGTLGGLVEEGRRFHRHLRRALELGELCSSDPVCATHLPASLEDRPLEGAACHGCLYVAECSCEQFNHSLDRALVVPTFSESGAEFFSERP